MGDLIRECGEIINYSERFPVDVVQASKLRFLRAKGDGLELQTMPSPTKRARAPYLLCSPSDPYRYYPAYRERWTTFIKARATRGKPFPSIQSADA